jgi:hypothetical protein
MSGERAEDSHDGVDGAPLRELKVLTIGKLWQPPVAPELYCATPGIAVGDSNSGGPAQIGGEREYCATPESLLEIRFGGSTSDWW